MANVFLMKNNKKYFVLGKKSVKISFKPHEYIAFHSKEVEKKNSVNVSPLKICAGHSSRPTSCIVCCACVYLNAMNVLAPRSKIRM